MNIVDFAVSRSYPDRVFIAVAESATRHFSSKNVAKKSRRDLQRKSEILVEGRAGEEQRHHVAARTGGFGRY
ncbi:MAG TPA: hypothetical protein P5081_18435 [Phycisphaerae bacterium]|nr:hypothetical protein [Phycisphaerae bacterium]HRW54851.1 hypothetical protein [Phycisphaerae bacterium]